MKKIIIKFLIGYLLILVVILIGHSLYEPYPLDKMTQHIRLHKDDLERHGINNQMRVSGSDIGGGYHSCWKMGDIIVFSKQGSGIDPPEHWIVYDTAAKGPPIQRLLEVRPHLCIYEMYHIKDSFYSLVVRY